MDLKKHNWSKKYLQICEETLNTPNRTSIHGALVAQLKLDVCPVVNSSTNRDFDPTNTTNDDSERNNNTESTKAEAGRSKCNRNNMRRVGRRSFEQGSIDLQVQRRSSFAKIVDEETEIYECVQDENIYESADDLSSDGYLLPVEVEPSNWYIEVTTNNLDKSSVKDPYSHTYSYDNFETTAFSNFGEDYCTSSDLSWSGDNMTFNKYDDSCLTKENSQTTSENVYAEITFNSPIQSEKESAVSKTVPENVYTQVDHSKTCESFSENYADSSLINKNKEVVYRQSDNIATKSFISKNQKITDVSLPDTPGRRDSELSNVIKFDLVVDNLYLELIESDCLEEETAEQVEREVKEIKEKDNSKNDNHEEEQENNVIISGVEDLQNISENMIKLYDVDRDKVNNIGIERLENEMLDEPHYEEIEYKRNVQNYSRSPSPTEEWTLRKSKFYEEIESKRNVKNYSGSGSPREEWTLRKKRNACEDVQPVYKSYLYQMQLKAPKPQRVVCPQNFSDKPSYYGKEYHGPIPRETGDQLVMKCEGCYLTRESTRQPGTYALTFRFNQAPRNYRLYYDVQEQMHYVGEKRFETIHDLVADGLITLYVDYNAKDYIEHMTLDVRQTQHGHSAITDEEDNRSEPQLLSRSPIRPMQNTFKASECEKAHNFKTHSYYGPHWCHFCRNFMWGLKAQGVRCQDCLYDCHKQCSTLIPPNCSPDKKLVKRVFGVDLTTLIKAHEIRRPAVVDSFVKEIEHRGLDLEGLYRIPGFADDITYLQNAIDKDGTVPDITEAAYDDVNVICGVLKLYFRMLPIPIIPFDLYEKFIEAVKLDDRYESIKCLGSGIKVLPPAHFETLKYFCRHLQRITKFQDKNLMNSENLGIVFGPTLMRAPDHMTLEAIGFIPYQKKIVQLLIEEQDVLFE